MSALRLSIVFGVLLLAQLAWAGEFNSLADLSFGNPRAVLASSDQPASPPAPPLRIELYDPFEELAEVEAEAAPVQVVAMMSEPAFSRI
jgi:hypothetical protein